MKTWKKVLAIALCLTLVAYCASGIAFADGDAPHTVSALVSSASGILPPEKNFVIDTLNETLGLGSH